MEVMHSVLVLKKIVATDKDKTSVEVQAATGSFGLTQEDRNVGL